MCYITAPFIILTFEGTWTTWTRVYFYGLVGILALTGLFASPVRMNLKKKIEARAKAAGVSKTDEKKPASIKNNAIAPHVVREEDQPVYGLPPDPEGEFEEIVKEIKQEVEARQRKGIGRTMTEPAPAMAHKMGGL